MQFSPRAIEQADNIGIGINPILDAITTGNVVTVRDRPHRKAFRVKGTEVYVDIVDGIVVHVHEVQSYYARTWASNLDPNEPIYCRSAVLAENLKPRYRGRVFIDPEPLYYVLDNNPGVFHVIPWIAFGSLQDCPHPKKILQDFSPIPVSSC